MIILSISKDFSKKPGWLRKDASKDCAEDFYENVLEPKYKEAIEAKTTLLVDLDGTIGYAYCFLAYAFGKLEVTYPGARKTLMFKSVEEPYLIEDIRFILDETTKSE